jgi:cyclopropane fatty-acyl-phospholipid synthase-like methyltransferase
MGGYCPVCRSNEYTAIGKPRSNLISREFINKDYLVVQCNNCKVYYVSPEINFTDEQWSRLYNSDYFAMQSNILIKRRQKELEKRFESAEKLRESNGNVKFLDIGTGEGKTLIAGLERNWDVTGIDIVDNRIPEAKTDKINFYC